MTSLMPSKSKKSKMKYEEILKKVLEKAVVGGCNKFRYEAGEIMRDHKAGFSLMARTEEVIFDHEFAKAFWGEEDIDWHIEDISDGYGYGHDARERLKKLNVKNPLFLDSEEYFNGRVTMKVWQYHLQQLVLSGDRSKYLSQFLPKEK